MHQIVISVWRWLIEPRGNFFVFALQRTLACYLIPLPFIFVAFIFELPVKNATADSAVLVNVTSELLMAPLLENGVLVLVAAYMRFFFPPTWSALIAATLIATLHGFYSVLWGLSVLPLFFVQASVYLAWAARGRLKAYLLTVLMHALFNVPHVIATSSN